MKATTVMTSDIKPKKLEKENKMSVPRVVGLEGFNNFLETGEFAE